MYPAAPILMQSDHGDPALALEAAEFNATFRMLPKHGTWFASTIYYDVEPMLRFVQGPCAVSFGKKH